MLRGAAQLRATHGNNTPCTMTPTRHPRLNILCSGGELARMPTTRFGEVLASL